MTSSGDEATTRGAGLLVSRCRKLAGFTPAIALLSILFFQIDDASARGRAEDRRLNLSLDTQTLIDLSIGEGPVKSSESVTRDPQAREGAGSAADGSPRWEDDSAFLRQGEPGDPRKSEFEFRDSQFGNQIRRFLGR